MVELIITEKPQAALKIATALADKDLKKNSVNKVPYYELTHKNKNIIVGCAVGHLYNVTEKDKKGWTYPVFDLAWKESYLINKNSDFSKKYLDVLKKLSKKADEFTVACDYDTEGEVIGLNIVRFACNQKDAKRMKFSTLTKDELQESYQNASKHLDWLQAEAGETRHFLDYLWGINLSRALTLSIKNSTNAFKILSIGRVQGPSLKILTERELEIQKFKPEPYWQIEAINKIQAWHKKDKFWKEEEANKIYNKIKNEKKALIKDIKKSILIQAPPNPFDLTSLQIEAYRMLKISPKETLAIAQNLYTTGLISYPRTSSNQLSPKLNYSKILNSISKQSTYKDLCKKLLSQKILKPNNGTKKDPAHPAIYPTGEIPKAISEREKAVYDLIVRRILASFAPPAKRESCIINLEIKEEPFVANGIITIEKGWHEFYGKYAKFKDIELPQLKKGEKISIKKIVLHSEETKPPRRYTQASIIKELEKRNLGTKATRAAILDALYDRNYVKEKQIEVTTLGLKIIETLDKYCPEILDEKLTRAFEEDMQGILEKKHKEKEILERAKKELTKTLEHFKENESKIGQALSDANKITQKEESFIGKCPVCKKGDLRILYSKQYKSHFIACDKYPECKTTFSVPLGLIKPTKNFCKECNYPIVNIIRKGRRPFEFCINKNCPKKIAWRESQKA